MQHCHALDKTQLQSGRVEASALVAIVGPSNAGKSVLFNGLTGEYSIVANYPQTTVAPSRRCISVAHGAIGLVDTPGIASLNVTSRDERSTLKVLFQDSPQGVLFCGDALHLKRSLVLLAQLLELELPTIVCFNKADQAASSGMAVDMVRLGELMAMPVIEIAAAHGIGFDKVQESLNEFLASKGGAFAPDVAIRYPVVVEQTIDRLRTLFSLELRPSRGLVLLFMQGDETARNWFGAQLAEEVLAEAGRVVEEFHARMTPVRLQLALFQAREAWANRLAERTVSQANCVVPTLLQKAGWVTRHPVFGWPIFLAILWLTFKGVGIGAVDLGGWLDGLIFSPLTQAIGDLVTYPLLNEFLVGQFGILTMGVANAMVTVVPILLVFFLIVHFLEDIGYLPNLSVLANRALSALGLTGKAVLPLVLGSGCNTTATMSSRILATRKERLLVSFLVALGVPCSVQMGVLFAILATMPFSALLIVLSAVMFTSLGCGMIMNRLLPGSGQSSEFILELPSFHWPHPRNIVRKTYFRIKWFLLEAVPLFMAAAVVMFLLDKSGLL
ncbi:MAG: ferrous iron transporter B, partial [Magnetococcales bacterium]|nr:ferrous iron transporter B [Magnetococcales bacterium]